jgi:hypothetical protein
LISVWFPFLVFAVVFIYFQAMQRKVCPHCNQPLPLYYSPFKKTKRQWVEGGYVCPHCGCESDVTGREVPAGTPLQYRALYFSLGRLTLAVVSGVVLLTLLFRGSFVARPHPPLIAKPQHSPVVPISPK